jgi:hypothetical protein
MNEPDRFEVHLPAVTVQAEQPFDLGTVLRLALQVRVKGWKVMENPRGELVHTVALTLVDEAQVVASFDPADTRDDTSGAASRTPSQPVEGPSELGGLEIRRTSETWPAALRAVR